MKVRISFTVDVDYTHWVAQMEQLRPGQDTSRARCRDNLQALAEEAFAHTMSEYTPFEFVEAGR